MLTHQKLFIVGNTRLITLLCPISDINCVVLLNISSRIWLVPLRLEDGSCMDLISYLCINKKHCFIWYLFCLQPTNLS